MKQIRVRQERGIECLVLGCGCCSVQGIYLMPRRKAKEKQEEGNAGPGRKKGRVEEVVGKVR